MAVKFRKRRTARPAAVPPRVTVDPAGDWRACTDTLPRGCAVMGTVSVGRTPAPWYASPTAAIS
jgi:hypothetical protein